MYVCVFLSSPPLSVLVHLFVYNLHGYCIRVYALSLQHDYGSATDASGPRCLSWESAIQHARQLVE